MQFFKKFLEKRSLSLFLVLTLLATMIPFGMSITFPVRAEEIDTGKQISNFGTLFDEFPDGQNPQFIVVKHKQLGGSHYAYTDGLSDETGSPEGNEMNFDAGSQMVLVTLKEITTTTPGSCGNPSTETTSVERTETVLLTSDTGVIRDPDVSKDGTKVLFSWKKNEADDFHLYEMEIKVGAEPKQLTFGSGVADVEPKYLPNGKIVFQSTRCISNVDCWLIAVMNTYICDGDGSNIIRVGYDQVHTTYPTVTEDGRILYTRWDYNDRNQMYIQGVFQMFPDGTNQTEVYGNNSNFPTTLLHTREIPGKKGVYVSISSGHHTWQAGKLVLVDTNVGRNDEEAVSYVFSDENSNKDDNVDTQGQDGALYKYPVALNDHEFLVSYAEAGWEVVNNERQRTTPFDIYYMNSETGEKICISESDDTYGGASQVAMVKAREMFERPSMVNQAVEYGTYYMGNVYEGGGLEGVEEGTAKYLRVVEIEYRPYAIGATKGHGTGDSDPYTPVSAGNGSWDVKRVLGIVGIEEDGSALFRVPANTPIYFQVLNADGELIQSMRSWSTLMPNETFSCVGCHEDKNTVPPYDSTTTLAMKKGVQELQPDLWMSKEDGTDYKEGEYDVEEDTKGFSYTEMVQPILNANCIDCHNDQETSLGMIGSGILEPEISDGITVVELGSEFKYSKETQNNEDWKTTDIGSLSGWSTGNAPFGDRNINGVPPTPITGVEVDLYLRKDFTLPADMYKLLSSCDVYLRIFYDQDPKIYLNGSEIFSAEGWLDNGYIDVKITDAFINAANSGNNELAAYAPNRGGGMFIDFGIYLVPNSITATLIEKGSSFKYTTSKQKNNNWSKVDFNDSTWQTANAPFGGNINVNGIEWNNWETENLYLRSSFHLTQEQRDMIQTGEYNVYINIFWDEDTTIYLNGTKILSRTGYVTEYKKIKITYAFMNAMQVGENIITASVINTTGGQFIDFSIYLQKKDPSVSDSSFSLEGIPIEGPREEIYYSLSYLVLTNSVLEGTNYVANSTNDYTNWISSMSRCEMLDPYQFGSTQSNIILMLKNGHGGTNLTAKEIDTIAAWIDLGVPYRGAYDENPDWGINDYREATIKQNKRDYYDTLDETTKRILGGKEDTDKLPITINYSGNSTSVTDNGMAILYPGTSYKSGDKVTVTLPEGVEYFFFALDSRIGEALIYAPSGIYTYTIPYDVADYFPSTFRTAISPTISARIATDEELTETRNLAHNPYDVSENTASATAFPHVNASTQYDESEFAARNAIDGFAINNGHGTYPLQSWGAAEGATDSWYNMDFGREVCVDSVAIAVRADWSGGHDTYYTSAVLEFSDGTTQNITLEKDSDMQTFEIEGGTKATSYVKIKNMETAGTEWAGLSEVEVYGTVYEEGTVPLISISVPSALTLDVGVKKQIPLTFLPGDATVKSVVWSSSDESVAKVDENGVLFAVGAGKATITVTVDGLTTSCQVTVIKSTTGITVYDYETGETITVYYPYNDTMSFDGMNIDDDYLYVAWYDKQESAADEKIITNASSGQSIYLQSIEIDKPIVEPEHGASIRLEELESGRTNGLRFRANINREEFYQYFMETKDADYVYAEYSEKFSFGMLLIPKKLLNDQELTLKTDSVLNIPGKKVFYQKNEKGDLEYTGVLTGMPQSFYEVELVARAYVTFTFKGETYTIYSKETDQESYLSVAKKAYADAVKKNDEITIQALEKIFGDTLQN